MIAARAAALAVLATGCLSKPSFECTFEMLPNSDLQGAQLGTGGGGDNPGVDCGRNPLVGLEIGMTQGPAVFDQQVAVTTTMRCATVSTRGGAYSTGAIAETPVPGGDSPTSAPNIASCPDGQVAIGIVAHVVEMTVDASHLLNSFSLECSAVDETGAPTGSLTRLPMIETGAVSPETEIRCDAGHVIHGLSTSSGSLLDQLEITCGRMTCAPPE